MALAREFALDSALVAVHLLGRCGIQEGPEGGYLNHLMIPAAPVDDVHDAKAPSDDEGPPKQRLHLLGRGVGGHVEVLGPPAHQEVAHRTAHHIGFEAGILQCGHDIDRTFVDQAGINAVFLRGHLHAPAQGNARGRYRIGLAQQLVDESFDHGKSRSIGHPRCWATSARDGAGLVATGWVAHSSRGRSLMESL